MIVLARVDIFSIVGIGILYFAMCIRDALEIRARLLYVVCRAGGGAICTRRAQQPINS